MGKNVIRFGGSTQSVNLYPSDFNDIVNLEAEVHISTWGMEEIIGTVTRVRNQEKETTGYTIMMKRGDESSTESLSLYDSIIIFTGKTFGMKKIIPPKGLRNKISFALGMNRDKRVKSLTDLHDIYKEQIKLHDEAILRDLTTTDKAYIPVRLDFENFHILAVSDRYGQFNLSDGYHFLDGFLKSDQALHILSIIPPKLTDIRKVEWIKSIITMFPEDDTIYQQRKPYTDKKRSS